MAIMGRIEDYTILLLDTGAVDDNFTKWPVLGTYVWPNNFIGNSHDEEVSYLKDWTSERLTWLDNSISGL